MIATLLSLFWNPDEAPEIKAKVAEHWIGDLEEFGPRVVADACAEWRRSQTRRPAISELRAICFELQTGEQNALSGADRVAIPDYTTSDRGLAGIDDRNRRFAEAAEWRQKFAEEHGFRNFSEVMQYGILRAWNRQSDDAR